MTYGELPTPGQIALVRQRRYLVESVAMPTAIGESTPRKSVLP